ncbi:hypothetical protein R9X47_09305 [Wukongibacter baidiensis]|uniref:hypothetical protein n=1 Tax=Wukongibacter baidiensis TaxID=1723361 RepID=UPI003D7FC80E
MNKKIVTTVFLVFLVLLVIFVLLPKPSVAKNIESDNVFQYSTSITGNYNSTDRANVYTTDMSVPDTARYIISKNRPESYTDLNNEESIQLAYDDYQVLIYKGEGSITYVQISSRKFIHRNGYSRLYRPYRRNIIVFYDRSYRSGGYYRKDSKRYGGGYSSNTSAPQSTTSKDSNKIQTDKNSSSKIKTDSNSSSKIKTNSSPSTTKKSIFGTKSIRNGSSGTRTSFGGGTSFGK